MYAMCAMRHMHEFGTTSEQLAWVKVAASHHAQYNPHAMLRDVVTVEEVVNSPMIADPLHRLDCCVISDGGGALIVTRPEIAKSLKRPMVKIIGAGEAPKHQMARRDVDLTYSGGAQSGKAAFEEAGVKPSDIKYASIYDSFTITVVMQLEDLGFCKKGEGGKFVADGNLISGVGKLPFNTDGGGLCNNHPANRGGMTKVIEAVRQLRGEAHPKVQVKNCDLALAHGTGGSLGTRHVRRDRHHGTGVRHHGDEGTKDRVSRAHRRHGALLGRRPQPASCCSSTARRATSVHHYPRALCPLCFSDKLEWKRGQGHGQDLHLQRHAPRARALRHRLRDARRRRDDDDQHRRLRLRQGAHRPAVKVVFKPSENGQPVPMFAPA